MKTILRLLAFALTALHVSGASTTPISSLPAAPSVNATDLTIVVNTGLPNPADRTQKANVSQLVEGLPDATNSTRGIMTAADKLLINNATNAATASTLVKRDGSGNAVFNAIALTAGTVSGTPVNPSDIANKAYVDAASAGLVVKTPARAATVGANITLSGGAPNTLDGVTLALNDRVLVKDQSDGTQNGIYYVSTLGTGSNGTWDRTTDADTGAELVTGSYVFITGGTVNANAAYTMVTPGTITIGSSIITWNIFSQVTQIQASNILGQLVASQIQDAAINTAKFALGIEPVSIVSSLPSPSGYTGPKTVFNTGDGKLYRYVSGSFTAAVPATDMTGQITTTQIQDNSISTPKLQANSVTATQLAANSVVAGDITANAVTAGTIAAAAVNTNELAAGAVNASKIAVGSITADRLAANSITAAQIQAGSITADRLTISSLSAISANIGTITSGTLTSSISISVGSGLGAVSISTSGLLIGSGRISMVGDGASPWIRVTGVSPYNSARVELNGGTSGFPPNLTVTTTGGSPAIVASSGGLSILGNVGLTVFSGSTVTISSGASLLGPGQINLFGGNSNALSIVCGEDGAAGGMQGYLNLQVNGRAVKVPFYNL